jgi:xanthosine utilization system XapX-like protein
MMEKIMDEQNINGSSPSQTLRMMHVMKLADQTPLVLGSVGVGKSETIYQFAESLAEEEGLSVSWDNASPTAKQFGLVDFRLSHFESVDFGGLPYIVDGVQKRAMLGNLPTKGKGLLFLDEFAQAGQDLQAIASQLIKERRLGEYVFPEGWSIVLAGNRHSDRSSANKIVAHGMGRVGMIEFESNANDWLKWASENSVDERLIAFIQYQPQYLNNFDPKIVEPSATPRTITNLSKVLAQNPDKDILQNLIYGFVGREFTAEFMAFITLMQDVPNLEKVLGGKKVDVPEGVGLQYATAVALTSTIKESKDSELAIHFENALKFVEQFQTDEFAIFFVRTMVGIKSQLKQTKVYSDFVVRHQDLLI